VGERDLTFFYVELWRRQLELQIHEEAMSPAAHGTTNEPGDRKKQPMAFELRGGPDDEVQDLMNLAIERPKQFCKALCAALLTPPKGWRARARRKGALGRWAAKQETAKATHVKIEICFACALFNSEI
jgi:hypothetical protein